MGYTSSVDSVSVRSLEKYTSDLHNAVDEQLDLKYVPALPRVRRRNRPKRKARRKYIVRRSIEKYGGCPAEDLADVKQELSDMGSFLREFDVSNKTTTKNLKHCSRSLHTLGKVYHETQHRVDAMEKQNADLKLDIADYKVCRKQQYRLINTLRYRLRQVTDRVNSMKKKEAEMEALQLQRQADADRAERERVRRAEERKREMEARKRREMELDFQIMRNAPKCIPKDVLQDLAECTMEYFEGDNRILQSMMDQIWDAAQREIRKRSINKKLEDVGRSTIVALEKAIEAAGEFSGDDSDAPSLWNSTLKSMRRLNEENKEAQFEALMIDTSVDLDELANFDDIDFSMGLDL